MRGFTLVEMLIVVALLSVMGVLAVSALGPMNTRYRVTQGTELAQQELYQARTWARETGRCHRVQVFDEATDAGVPAGTLGNAIRVERRINADCETAPGPTDYEPVELVRMPHPNVQVRAPSGQLDIVWRPNGRLYDANYPYTNKDLYVGDVSGGTFTPRSQLQLRPQGVLCVTDPAAPGSCP